MANVRLIARKCLSVVGLLTFAAALFLLYLGKGSLAIGVFAAGAILVFLGVSRRWLRKR